MEEEAAAMLLDYLESWGSNYDWKAVFFMTFLVITFELLLLELCRICHKKLAERKIQKESSSNSLEEEENTFLKNFGYENWPRTQLPPKRRLASLSRSQFLSSLDSQNTEYIFNEMLSTSYETWSGNSDNESQLSWPSGSGSWLSFSSEAISSSSFLNSVHRKRPSNQKRFSHLMFETLPFSSRKLLPIRKMHVNKNKNVRFSSDHNFLRKSKVTLENDDLDLTPCPSAHLYLPRNQIRLLEENLRNQIPSKSQPVVKIKTTYQSSNFAKLNQAPPYPSEEISCKREKMPQESLFHYQGNIGPSVFFHPQTEVSVQTETPGQAHNCNPAQNSINIQTSIKVQDLSKFPNTYFGKQFTTNFLDESPPILSLRKDKTINPHILNIMENLNMLNQEEEQKKSSILPSTYIPISPQTKHKSGICSTDLKNTMGPRVVSIKAKKKSYSQLLNIPGYGTLASRKKLEWHIAKSESTCEMNTWNVLPDSVLKDLQGSGPNSSFDDHRIMTNTAKPRDTRIKFFPQVQSKKLPQKISYAQPLEKIPQSVENKGEFRKSTDTSRYISKGSDIKKQKNKDYGMIRTGLTVNNKEKGCLSCSNKIDFLALKQDTQQPKCVHQTALNSDSSPKKFSFQPEYANEINDVIYPESFKISNSLGKNIKNKTDMPEYECSRTGKKVISRQKTLQPKVVLKSFLCSIFAPVKSPLQREKQEKKEYFGEDMNRIIQDQSQGAEEASLIEIKYEPLFDSERVANLQTAPCQEDKSLIKTQLVVECDSPRDSMTQGNDANQQEWFTTKLEGQPDKKCSPITISKSGNAIKPCVPPLEQTPTEISKDSKTPVSLLSSEEIKRSLENHMKATNILHSIYSTVPNPSQIKIKYVKIMEDKNNSVCIPIICEEIKPSESKVESGIDSKFSNAPMTSPNTTKRKIVVDVKNTIPSPEIKKSDSWEVSEIDTSLTKSDATSVEILSDVNSVCCASVPEEIKLPPETQIKTEDFSESNITSTPCPCSAVTVQPVEDIKETVVSSICEEFQKPPDDTSQSSDVCFYNSPPAEPNSLNYEEKIKKSPGPHIAKKDVLESIFTCAPNKSSKKTKTVQVIADMSNLVCSSVGEEMQKSFESSTISESSDMSISFPPEAKRKSVQTLEDVKKSVCSPICDEIIKSLESHITEAVSNSIDASTHSPCSIKKKSVEVVLDLKKSLLSLSIPVETKRSLESYIKTGGVTESRGTSIPVPFQKKISQLASDMKNSSFFSSVCGEMPNSVGTHIKIPPERNWEIDRKREKFPQQETFQEKKSQEHVVADVKKEMQAITHLDGRKKGQGIVIIGNFKSQSCSISVLDRLTANEKTKLIFHFQKKRLELKQGRIHTIAIESYQKLPSPIKPCISKDAHSDRRVFPRCRKLKFMLQEEIDSIEMNLKHKYLMFLLGLPVNSRRSLKEIIPKAVTPIPEMIYQKCKTKYIEKNVIVIKKEVREKLESHIREKQKLRFSNSIMNSFPQSFFPSPPKNIYGPEEESSVKRVICSLFIEGETKRSLPCYLRKVTAEQKDVIPSKLMKCENTTKELCPVSSMKAVIVNKLNVTNYINENIKQAVEVNMQLRLNQKSSHTPAETKGRLFPLVFQRFTVNDLRKFITHFLVKTLEIKMSMIPGVVEESIKMVDNQVQRKPQLESVYHTNKVKKLRSTKLPFMDPKSLHQIILNLQHKCLMTLLGLPVETQSPKLTMPPKYLPRPKLNKNRTTVHKVGNQVCFSIDMEKLEQHISFKKQNPYKIPPSILKLLKSFVQSVYPSEYIPKAMDDRTILGKTPSLNSSRTILDSQCLTQKNRGDLSLRKRHKSLSEEKFNNHLKVSPKLTTTVPDPPKDAPTNIDNSEDSKVSCFQKVEICPEPQKNTHKSPPTSKKVEFVTAQTNTDIVFDFHKTLPQKTENAPDFFEIHSDHSTSPEICDIFETKKGVKAKTESHSLKASPQKTEVASPQKTEVASPQKTEVASPQKSEVASPQKTEVASPQKSEVASPQKSEVASSQKTEVASPQKTEVASSQKTEVNLKRQENVQKPVQLKKSPPPPKKRVDGEKPSQKSVKLKKSPPPPKKKVELETPFQTPSVIFRTFKKSWENVPLSDGGPLRQDQKEMYFDIPFKLEEFISLEKRSKSNQISTKTKPVYQKGDLFPQNIQVSGRYNSLITSSYNKAHQYRKKKLHPKINSPYWMSNSSLESQSMPYSLPREDRLSRKTRSHTSCPLASRTDPSIKLKLEANDGKIILSVENKDGKKPNVDLSKENTMKPDHSYSFTESQEKQKKQEVYDSGFKSPEWHFLNKPKSILKQQEIDYFHFRRKNTQPFFYACTPADTPGNTSKTIRWNIPQNTSGQSKFRIPLVAKFSNPEKIWNSSKKFLESVSESFNLCPVHQK